MHNISSHIHKHLKVSWDPQYVIGHLQRFHFDGLPQNYGKSIANALELPQSCGEPSEFWSAKMWNQKSQRIS